MSKQEKKTKAPNQPRRASTKNGITKSYYHQPLGLHRLKTRNKSNNNNNPSLSQKLAQMRLTIFPIVHASTALPAPDFPPTLLSLFLLTERQLDALAAYYSQTAGACHLRHAYPATMNWSHPFLDTSEELPGDCKLDALERLKVKMRMFARFVGMRGADTPRWEYERQIEILGNRVRWEVRRGEEEEEGKRRGKVFGGPRRLR
ncbi:hypothetical protein J3E72DRAFT_192143 [Bipolaris maydis]|nr:hypothetical protein J3E73DRAFT_369402 [Bipolaris maydis]KAJ5059912.1 hypothetical protein J3E74DRAFT_216743 [Bipolaris maydis]KAJ6197121.1 hypothetical protein J3E72DRAFT_192143 [Bipolaris maydis]KAJ6209909.1 hypothetical protein PSV09DRAFT_2400114 [Bipolaris maydis]KAJ6271124.1 hypothetical protein PSV08DRAFT_350679 [Bipolaris maydis]